MKINKLLLTVFGICWAYYPVTGYAGPILLPRGEQTTWRYLDGAGAPAKGWQSVDFDDSGWKRGRGPLGYGESNLGTILGFGDDEEDKHMSVYCRTSFKVDPVPGKKLEALGVLLRRDDGAVVYLNGREVIRSNMDPGNVGFTTPAASATGPADEATYHRYMVPAEWLAKGGQNTVAIEVHQANPASSDLFLDLEISGYLPGEVPKRDFYRDGMTALRRGNYQQGTELLRQLPVDHPDYARTMAMLALQVYSEGLGRAKEGLEFAKKAYAVAPTDRQVVRAYIKTHVLSGVLFDDDAISRERGKVVAKEHGFLVSKPDLGDSSRFFSRAELEEDLDYLEHILSSCFAYLELKPVDYRGALDAIRLSLDDRNRVNGFELQLAKLISLFCDGHARMQHHPSEYLPGGYAPYLAGSYKGRVYLCNRDGKGLLDPEHPYVGTIDGRAINEWMDAASYIVVKESAQWRLRQTLGNLRYVNYLRAELGLPAKEVISLGLQSADGKKKRAMEVELARRPARSKEFPRGESRRIGDFGYLRVAQMTSSSRFLSSLEKWMEEFRDTKGMIIDVRGNSGGTKDILLTLMPYFLKPGDPMRVIEFSTYRKPMELPKAHPDGYMMSAMSAQPVTSSHWKSDAQRAQIAGAIKGFEPRWKLPMEKFSDWHVLAFDSTMNPRCYYYDKPLIILQDSGTFSAGDIFLGGFKGLENVTLMGMPSGGGNGWMDSYSLPNTGLGFVLCQSAKFLPTGEPYDGVGVAPDVVMEALPADILGGSDSVLDAALKRLGGK
ncbi:MAG: hypothetical protein GY899_12915 [Verrucomicrobiaceae bacterium]|nr:hypothetical protein [Verrucomicrobiaceae bacterium]